MSETREHGEREPAATASFHFTCTGCGAEIDAPDRYFTLGPMVLVPHAHHVLCTTSWCCPRMRASSSSSSWPDPPSLGPSAPLQ